MTDLKKLIRPHLLALKPYSSARDEYSGTIGTFLDANENPYGSVISEKYNRYPDPHQYEIKKKLGKLKHISPTNIFIGNGSDEAIDLLIKAFCEPKKDAILLLPPTYGMYQVCADIQEVKTIYAPLTPEFEIDKDAIAKAITAKTKMIWICSPNNPSGNLVSTQLIEELLTEYPSKIIVIDEAYIDFTQQKSFIESLGKFKNLVIIQTFSKAWGMAGLRVGVCYAAEEIIAVLDKIKYPYNLNAFTQKKVLKALQHEDKKNKFVEKIIKNRIWLENKLTKLPNVTKIFPSDSNQLLVRFEDASAVFEYLLTKKVIVRDRTKVLLCDGCIRISVGTMEENKKLMKALKKFVRNDNVPTP